MKQSNRYRPMSPSIAPRTVEVLQNMDLNDGDSLLDEMFRALMEDVVGASASDLHLDPGKQDCCLRMRVDGALHDVKLIPDELATRIVNHFKVTARLDPGPTIVPDEGWPIISSRTDFSIFASVVFPPSRGINCRFEFLMNLKSPGIFPNWG